MSSRRLDIVLNLDSETYTGKITKAGAEMRAFSGSVDQGSKHVRAFGQSFDGLNAHMMTPMMRLREYVLILGNLRFAIINVRDIMVGWVAGLVKQSAEVQRLGVLMEGLSKAHDDFGKKTEAAQNLAALFEMARKNGFAMQELTDSFVKMKSAGLEPLDGSLQALTDAVARFGGNSDTMHRAAIAIQQMAGKGVVSMEELRQQLGEAVPTAIADMARAMGKSVPEFTKAVSKGAVQAKPALAAMFKEFELLYAGSGERMAQTMTGQLAQFKTNMMELSIYFTGMSAQMAPATIEWNRQQKELFDNGKISFKEYQEAIKPIPSLFDSVSLALGDVNNAMRSLEGRKFMMDLGQSVASVLRSLMSFAQFVVTWKTQIVFAITTIATSFAALKAIKVFEWMVGGAAAAVSAFRGVDTSVRDLANSTNQSVRSISQLSNWLGTASRNAKEHNENEKKAVETAKQSAAQSARKIVDLQRESAQLAQRSAQITQNIAIIERELVIETEKLNVARAAHAENVAMGQATVASAAEVAAAEGRVLAVEEALAANKRYLAQATQQAVVAEAEMTVAVNAEALAAARATAGVTELTFAQRALAVASSAASAATTAFGTAVNFVLGPIGQLIILLGTAAWAAGVFESKADRAAAAAARLAQGIADADAMKDAVSKKEENDRIIAQAADVRRRRGNDAVSDKATAKGDYRALFAMEQKALKSNAELAPAIARGQLAINIDKGRTAAQGFGADRSGFRNATASELGQELDIFNKSKQTKADRARYEAARKRADQKNTAFDDAELRRVDNALAAEQRRPGGGDKNKIQELQAQQQALKELTNRTDNLATSTNHAAAATANHTRQHRQAKSEAEKLRDRIADLTVANEGQIAQMNDALLDGGGHVAKFEAQLAASSVKGTKYFGATTEQVKKLRDQFAEMDRIEQKLDFKRAFDPLKESLAASNLEGKLLWDALKNGTWEATQATMQLTMQFEVLKEKFKGNVEMLAQLTEMYNYLRTSSANAEGAKMTRDLEQETRNIYIDLMPEKQGKKAAHDAEIERKWAEIQSSRMSAEERKKAEDAFYKWKEAKEAQLKRTNEGAVAKMARDWSNLGDNIENSMAGLFDGFINDLAEGKASFGDFAKSIIKDLVKIILKAMIAKFLLGALGLGGGGGGLETNPTEISIGANKVLSGIPTGIGSISTGLGGGLGGGIVPGQATGGWMGRPLKPGEIPIIGHEGEVVLNQDQQAVYARMIANGGGNNQAPNISVNVINNSGTQLEAKQGSTEFNGKEAIVGVIIDAMNKQGPLRDSMHNMMSKRNRP